jgi:2-oxoisovalerate dehydrogenase E1 component
MFGVGAELGQAMNEIAYDELDAPVARLHTEPVTHPFGPALERAMLVNADRIVAASRDLIKGVAAPIRRLGGARGYEAPVAASVPTIARAAPAIAAPQAVPADGEAITMPFGDLTVSEGKIVRWLKRAGDAVREAEIVAEVETDKAVVEIESPCAGVIARVLEPEGTVVKMGQRIALVSAR